MCTLPTGCHPDSANARREREGEKEKKIGVSGTNPSIILLEGGGLVFFGFQISALCFVNLLLRELCIVIPGQQSKGSVVQPCVKVTLNPGAPDAVGPALNLELNYVGAFPAMECRTVTNPPKPELSR